MAVAATMVWEMRTTGAATNGGGYKSDAGTTDYSQQDAAQLALTDVVVTQAAPTTLTSATAAFTAAMVGNTVYLSGGTGGTVTTGWYEITARADASNITIDRTCAPTAATVTAVTCNVGGALYVVNGTNLVTLLTTFAAGNTLWIKAGTYMITTANVTAGTAGTALAPVEVIGYNTIRSNAPAGDNRPLISLGGYVLTLGTVWNVANMRFEGTANPPVTTATNCNARYVNCSFAYTGGSNRPAFVLCSGGRAIGCEFSGGTGIGSVAGGSNIWYIGCWYHDTAVGMSCGSIASVNATACLFEQCGSGFQSSTADRHAVWGNTFVGCNNALEFTDASNAHVIANNIITYCTTGIVQNAAYIDQFIDYNNFYGNGTDVSNATKGGNDTGYDPAFQGLHSWTDLVVSAGSNVVITSVTGGFSTYFAAGDWLWIDAAAGWTSNAYRIVSVDSATQLTLATSPAAVNTTGGIARTIRTAVGVSDCRPGTASDVLTAGLGLTLGVGS